METSRILHKLRIKDLLGISKLIAILLLGVSLIGCGKFGKKLFGLKDGEPGPAGPAGPGTKTVRTGVITNNPQTIIFLTSSTLERPLITVLLKEPTFSSYHELGGVYDSLQGPYYSSPAGYEAITIWNAPIGSEYILVAFT